VSESVISSPKGWIKAKDLKFETVKEDWKKLTKIFLISCLVGTVGEGVMGWLIRFAIGDFLWIYPNSPFITTSLYVIPLWGLAGLICYSVFRKIGVLP